ncbi:hypothetical protein N9516_01880 [Gammaproteobacteria bacterium]|nr:hypothetical protein [Gammaproteobacteria bacterium]
MRTEEIKSKKSGFVKFDHISQSKSEVNHSSALFFVVESKIKNTKTELFFLNYWRLKRKVTDLTGRITLRNLSGEPIFEEEFKVVELKAHAIKLSPILISQGHEEFTGTAELEFFSKVNLFVPYPAVIVRYSGDDWHTGMHSTARYYYKDSGDPQESIELEQHSVESNITLFSEPGISNQVILHNGVSNSLNQSIALVVTNHLGRQLKAVLPEFKMGPRETICISVDDHIDYKPFLFGKRGMLAVEYSSIGVFPRIMYLNKTLEGEFSVEHSNFGQSEDAHLDCLPTTQPDRNLLFSFPVLPKGYNTSIDIFPTYPVLNSPYTININSEDFEGNNLSIKEILLDPKNPFLQFNFEPQNNTSNIKIDYMNPEKLPNRFHTAINYKHKDSLLPGITLDGPLPKTGRPIGTRWCPFFWDLKNVNTRIIISARTFDPSTKDDIISVNFELFGESEEERLSFERKMTQRQSLELNIREVLSPSDWTGNYGWAYMTFNPSSMFNVYFLSEKGDKSIMCDHAF